MGVVCFPCGLSHHRDMSVDGGVFKFLITIWVNGNMSASTSKTKTEPKLLLCDNSYVLL